MPIKISFVVDAKDFFVYNLKVCGVDLLSHRLFYEIKLTEGGKFMSEVRVKENESLDSALRRFKRNCARDGIMGEVRKREHYDKPSVKRKKKSEAARKRKFR